MCECYFRFWVLQRTDELAFVAWRVLIAQLAMYGLLGVSPPAKEL